jgi:hypothetical protein
VAVKFRERIRAEECLVRRAPLDYRLFEDVGEFVYLPSASECGCVGLR